MNTPPVNELDVKKQPAQQSTGQAERHSAGVTLRHEKRESTRRSYVGDLGTFECLVLNSEVPKHAKRV